MAINIPPIPSNRLSALEVMRDAAVIPVIVLHKKEHAVPMARALVAGGIRMLEVTLRTPAALACIEAIARDVPDAVVGAGTVRSTSDAHSASAAAVVVVITRVVVIPVAVVTLSLAPIRARLIRALVSRKPHEALPSAKLLSATNELDD